MFAFHETTRKRTCRTAFFALCLAPTCATAAWIADHHLPWRTAAAARRLSDRYHLDVALAELEEPRPRMTRTSEVALSEPGAAEPHVQLAGVETHRRGDALIVSIEQLTVAASDLPALAARLPWAVSRTDASKIELHVQTLVLSAAAANAPLELYQLRGVLERDSDSTPRLRAVAHVDKEPPADARPIALSVETRTSVAESAADEKVADAAEPVEPPSAPITQDSRQTLITLDTRQNELPVALLAPLVPGAAAFNVDATFTGMVTWQVASESAAGDAPRGALRGKIAEVDLSLMFPGNSPHQLAGRATVELVECRWQGERFERLVGNMIADGAKANGSFFIAARAYLGCPIDGGLPELQAAAERVLKRPPLAEGDDELIAANHSLDHFACRFAIDAAGLAIEPRIPAASTLPAGTLAATSDRPLLFVPPLKSPDRLPSVAWLQFVASPPGAWIPFTPATLETARRLP
jgi:hypothetical protein